MSQGSWLDQKIPYQGYPYAKPITTEVASPTNTDEEALKSKDETTSSRVEEKLPYQGFPYVNRIVTEARTLNPDELATLAKWQNLPRRQLEYTIDGGKSQNSTEQSSSRNDTNNVVYVELPVESTNMDTNLSTFKPDLDPDRPRVYIDIPQGSSGMTDRASNQNTQYTDLQTDSSRVERPSVSKPDLDENRPVVYIDIPENSGSGVSQSNEEEEPEYVRDTILYDQFKDRRILLQDSDSDRSQSHSDLHSGQCRPAPPNTLNISIPGSSGYSSYTPYQTNETYVYGQTPAANDEFPLSQIPVNPSPNDYPAYPPPYQEIANSPLTPVSPTQVPPQTILVTEQPRVQVITTTPSSIMVDGRRKWVRCQHCNATIQTLVVEENGFYTHLLACLICLFILPLVICVYYTDYFKYKNHYCTVCHKKIGYQEPNCCCSSDINYVS